MGEIIDLEDYRDDLAQLELEGIQEDLDVVKEEVECYASPRSDGLL